MPVHHHPRQQAHQHRQGPRQEDAAPGGQAGQAQQVQQARQRRPVVGLGSQAV